RLPNGAAPRATRTNHGIGIFIKPKADNAFSTILLPVFTALVKLGLDFPCSENRSKERDERLYRLAHDAARAARSAFRPGRLWGEGVFGEANTPSRLRGGTRIENIPPTAHKTSRL
ncbi:hypothetical protein, partial [Chitinibacter sp. ZOR0017]|uniref:hypothetical protein n=1 Tax=Chitinibacter sp. ZOR0017 TaxID=1339254 RepID=UPI001E4FE06D